MNILMICLGNICRSPLAEGIMQSLCNKYNLDWHIESAGTGAWHIGKKPDVRSIEIAYRYNINISNQRARQISSCDFSRFDMVFAMDEQNLEDILYLAKKSTNLPTIELIMNHHNSKNVRNVPDPYYNGNFQLVFDLLYNACENFIIQNLGKSIRTRDKEAVA